MSTKTMKPKAAVPRRLTLEQVANLLGDTPEEIQAAVLSDAGFPRPDGAGTFLEAEIRELCQSSPDPDSEALPLATIPAANSQVPLEYLTLRLPIAPQGYTVTCRPRKHFAEMFSERERDDLARCVAGAAAAGLSYQGRDKRLTVSNIYGLMKWLREQLHAAVVNPDA